MVKNRWVSGSYFTLQIAPFHSWRLRKSVSQARSAQVGNSWSRWNFPCKMVPFLGTCFKKHIQHISKMTPCFNAVSRCTFSQLPIHCLIRCVSRPWALGGSNTNGWLRFQWVFVGNLWFLIWVFPQMVVFPKHPKMIIFWSENSCFRSL